MPIEDPTLRNAREAELATYANDIAAAIRPTAARYDRTGEFPFEHFEILRHKGALGLTVPEEYGDHRDSARDRRTHSGPPDS
ncbi:MAG: acyl-CoA dehydrogenase family protein, partial [Proteobacteria bacterium]|nr:acyl-CoA dehydrogenase family protein [Pseudomonadota bacterium]